MKKQLFYVMERNNPQLGTYYVVKGQMSRKYVRAYEKASYGSVTMHQFESQEKMDDFAQSLREQGKRVR